MRALLLLFVASLFSGCSERNIRQMPNVVLINIDDMGWRDVGFMGSEFYETPNIDRLAEGGMVFTNAYATASNCAPSRASLMTGKWTTRHGIYTVASSERGKSQDRKLIPIKNTTTLSTEHRILPEVLKENGYVTIHAGKWHLNPDPLTRGIDINIGGGHNGAPGSYYPPYKNVPLSATERNDYLTDVVMEKTLDVLDTISSPFFLNYAPYAVHTPIQPKKSLISKYQQKESWNGQDNADYATMVENVDRNIGLLFEKLRKRGLWENTLIIFTTDNGGLYGITKQEPLRAGKGSYYEGGIRVPLVLHWGNQFKGQNDKPVSNLDLFPTIVELTGIENPELAFDGQSLVNNFDHERPLFWHFPIYLQAYNKNDNENRDSLFRTRPGSAVRKGDWKLHHYYEDDGYELYNLKDDIGERVNKADSKPEKLQEMKALLSNWIRETGAPVPTQLNPAYEGM